MGGTRSSLETQGALKLFCRTQGWRDPQFFWDPALERKVKAAVGRLDGRLAVSMGELGEADFIVVAGADPVNEAPMLALALRQAQRRGAQVAVLDPRPVFLPCEFEHLAVPPGQLDAALGALVKGALSAEAAAGLTEPARKLLRRPCPAGMPGDPAVAGRLAALAEALQKSRKPVVVCGTDIVRETTPACAADIALLLKETGKEAGLFYLLPGANAFGAALLSAPDQADAAGQRPWGASGPGEPAGPGTPALSGEAILEGIDQGRIKALVLVENDPFWSYLRRGAAGPGPGAAGTARGPGLSAVALGKAGPRGAAHGAGVRANGGVVRQPGGPGAGRVAGAFRGDAPCPRSAPRSIRPGRFSTTSPGATPGPRRRFSRS